MGARRELEHYPPVMTSAEVAEMLNIPNVKLIQQMAREGRIPVRRIPVPANIGS